jgi:PDZ domain
MFTPSQSSPNVLVINLGRRVTLLVILLAFFSQSATADEWDQPSVGFYAISLSENADALKKFGKMPAKSGLLVMDVSPGSAAGKGGLKPLNIVTHVNRRPVGSMEDAAEVIQSLELGTPLVLQGWGLTPTNTWKRGDVKTKVVSRRESLLGSVTIEHDKVFGQTTYTHVLESKIGSENSVDLSIFTNDKAKFSLNCQVSCVSARLVGMQDLIVVNGEQRFKLPLGRSKVETVIGKTLKVIEWANMVVDKPDKLEAMDWIARSHATKTRVEGMQYAVDIDLDVSAHGRIRTMLNLHRMLTEQTSGD